MRVRYLVASAAIGALALTACGGGYSSNSSSAKPATASPAATATTGTTAVNIGDTPLGKTLVSPAGLTIYGLTRDTKTTSTCSGVCATAWPPVLVDHGWTVGSGLARAGFSTIVRADGSTQLVAGNWPLYTFSGDAKPGDVNGQGSGGTWFVVNPNGTLHKS